MEKSLPQKNQPNAMTGRTDLSRYDNSWFNPGPRWKILLWFLVNSVTLNTYLPLPVSLKRFVLKAFGAKLGTGVMIKPAVNVKYPWLLTIGSHVWIGEEVWIDNLCPVTIEDNVCLSQGAMLLTGNHNYRVPTFDLIVRPIVLRAGSWIGARAVVCPGVDVGAHAVLAVGSVATRTLDPYGIYQGNPAVRVRERTID
ncbi:putative colanic acid biosynthesis acetyltransferase WcaF [Spirosoma oryzae]|uniref:Putative colanic acid biosynthesis acetyltransferase WcaF n=2 Tax=Spirosoma TaxID=107 RepID=A0A2T0SUD2_9BACT|nr:WcaF family extracellular polysaccharide biosynthesis acetyltransferase [Spirosoma oryzae]PRY37008.1 putative colanic acid biosynthesis acetyltransferase WcaF [Spirosoma oryzae]